MKQPTVFAWFICLAHPFLAQVLVSHAHAAEQRPNILFIYTDDHSHRTVSCYPEAYPFARTPNIDRLARQGVRFTHAYIGTWCMPSRATMLTGHLQYGVQSMKMDGQYPGSTYDPQACRFWPRVFRRQGYHTAQIGKWHTGRDTGYGRDWDYQIVWNRPRYPKNAGNYYENQLIETNGGKPKLTPGYTTDNYTRWADEYIRGQHRPQDKPWYLWVCYGAVHGPFTPAQRHRSAYPDPQFPIPQDIFPPRTGKPLYVRTVKRWVKGPNGVPVLDGGFQAKTVNTQGLYANRLQDWVRQYHQGVLAIDEGIGKLLQAVRESGQLENTLVVFTADQGFAWGQHGLRAKLAPYDASIRSPLIVSMPGTLPQGAVCKHPVGGPDLPPTFFSFAGLPLPWKMHGHDLTPVLKNPQGDWPHPVLMTLTGQKYGRDTDVIPATVEEQALAGVPWWVSLTQGRYKYIRNLQPGEIEELYHLGDDPQELRNLALEPRHAARLSRFRRQMLAELKRTDCGFADRLPAVGTSSQ